VGVSNRRRYPLEVDLRISNHSERPFCAPNLTFVPPIQHFQARRGGPTQGEFPERPFAWGPDQATSATRRHGRIGHEQIFVAKTRLSADGGCDEKYRIGGELMPPDWRAIGMGYIEDYLSPDAMSKSLVRCAPSNAVTSGIGLVKPQWDRRRFGCNPAAPIT
jgi:hypothetical protein